MSKITNNCLNTLIEFSLTILIRNSFAKAFIELQNQHLESAIPLIDCHKL